MRLELKRLEECAPQQHVLLPGKSLGHVTNYIETEFILFGFPCSHLQSAVVTETRCMPVYTGIIYDHDLQNGVQEIESAAINDMGLGAHYMAGIVTAPDVDGWKSYISLFDMWLDSDEAVPDTIESSLPGSTFVIAIEDDAAREGWPVISEAYKALRYSPDYAGIREELEHIINEIEE